jgi:hypothetical protein
MTVVQMTFNGDSTAAHYAQNGSASSPRCGVMAGPNAAAGWFLSGKYEVLDYANASSTVKYSRCMGDRTDGLLESEDHRWTATTPAAITQVTLAGAAGNFAAGSEVWLVGVG